MKVDRVIPGTIYSPTLAGAVIVRDLKVGSERWPKGHRLSIEELALLSDPPKGVELPARITVLRLGPDDVHEDDAAVELAKAVGGPGTTVRGPAESRVDLLAEADGVVHVRSAPLELLDRIDPLAVFTIYDGQAVRAGDLVASVKVGPHAVERATLDQGLAIAQRFSPIVRVAPFRPRRVAAVVKQSVHAIARERFESSVRAKVESLGSVLTQFEYVADEPDGVSDAFGRLIDGPDRVDIILTAGGASTDPTDPFFVAIERCDGKIVRHGVPAHPGSMVWLAHIGRVDLIGLPTCGAYSKATAVDLLLPRLLTGERTSSDMAAMLGHGGVLTRSMRFRFPPYARDLDAPEG